MHRQEALELLRQHLQNENLVKHCIAVGAIMKGLANRFGEDEELWETIGILHDIDYEETKNDHERHGLISVEILKGKVPEEVLDAIPKHNELTGMKMEKKVDFALTCADAISGLIVATALVHPNKLSGVEGSSVKKKFGQKDFASSVDRNRILICEKIDLSLDDFIRISLDSMKEVKDDLGL